MLRLFGRTLILSILLLVAGPLAAAAQTPQAGAADTLFPDTLGLPELSITATDSAFAGVPAETAAGRYLVTFHNESASPEGAGIHFMQLPEGITVNALSNPATPADDADGDGTPDWTYETYQAGGVIAAQGQTAQVILDLVPGNYVVWGGFPGLPQAPVPLSVTGEMPGELPVPEAGVTVSEVNTDDGWAFEIDGTLKSGHNTIRIDNISNQPHFLFIEHYPEPIVLDQVLAYLMFDPSSGTPPPDMIDEARLQLTTSANTQSAGTTQWLAVNLEPGSHILSCFIGDPTMGGMPHAFAGMIDVIQVGG